MTDIVDQIDQLVDDALARPIVDDYSVNRYPRCWHCNREWHGMPITRQIADMYARGAFDESYRVDTDSSEILCHGSDFIGPMKAQPGRSGRLSSPWIGRIFEAASQRWWRTILPSNAIIDYDYERHRIIIQIGTERIIFNDENVRAHYEVEESTQPVMIHRRLIVDVLQELAPRIGGTWEPLTAPGVVAHP
jgi:hypothetical protein